jgi:3-deoxy-D-arabino-heptulosonate 7-phosphate (DAHP) synthase
MPATYDKIASQTLGTAQSSYTFTSIPSTYTDLIMVMTTTSANDQTQVIFNGDTATNYSNTRLDGNGSSATSGRNSSQSFVDIGYNNPGGQHQIIVQIMNYANTNTFKTFISRNSNAANLVQAIVGLYRSTSAITSMTITAQTPNFAIGSTFTLYGIKAA